MLPSFNHKESRITSLSSLFTMQLFLFLNFFFFIIVIIIIVIIIMHYCSQKKKSDENICCQAVLSYAYRQASPLSHASLLRFKASSLSHWLPNSIFFCIYLRLCMEDSAFCLFCEAFLRSLRAVTFSYIYLQ